MKKITLAIMLLTSISNAFAHSGRTDSSGCHRSKSSGYHCHSSKKSSYTYKTPSTSTSASKTRTKYDEGILIKSIQGRLIKQGYQIGNADGLLGTKTKNAILDYQRKNNLTPNGLASNSLLSHMISKYGF